MYDIKLIIHNDLEFLYILFNSIPLFKFSKSLKKLQLRVFPFIIGIIQIMITIIGNLALPFY